MLTHGALAKFRLSVRSDVICTWDISEVAYASGYYFQVKITVNGCGYKDALSKNKKTYNGLRSHIAIQTTRILLMTYRAFRLSAGSFYHLKKICMQPKGATKAYQRSPSLISNTEAPQFIGAGEGTDTQDFLADLSTLEVIDPDSKESKEQFQQDEGLPLEVPIPSLDRLNSRESPMLIVHGVLQNSEFLVNLRIMHNVVLQVSCCSPPSVFQTVMGMEL